MGVRMEFKRLQSGIEVGAWYAYERQRYHQPGLPCKAISGPRCFPVHSVEQHAADGHTVNCRLRHLAMDARRVGQMVASPGDLYDMFERPRADMRGL